MREEAIETTRKTLDEVCGSRCVCDQASWTETARGRLNTVAQRPEQALAHRLDVDQKTRRRRTCHIWSSTFVSSFENERASSRAILSTLLPWVATSNQCATVLSRRRPGDSIDGGQMSRCSRPRNGQRWHQHTYMASRADRPAPSTTARKRGVMNDNWTSGAARFWRSKNTPLN
jgi:hypothetical protein